MIAVDTNVLVYAHREEFVWHPAARDLLASLAEGARQWAIPWPCIHEFLAVVTHANLLSPPTPIGRALDFVEALAESPSLVLLAEAGSSWRTVRKVVEKGKASGKMIHDAKIAAICEAHAVSELWSADRDFSRFPGVRTRNPFVHR